MLVISAFCEMIRRNITANIVGRVWAVVSVYLFVPLYLEYLGVEGYGLVGFYVTLLGVVAFADMGLTATLNREMARLSVRSDSGMEQAQMLRTYELTYACISLVLAVTICTLAPQIARHWLQQGSLDSNEIVWALRLMGVAIGLQLPTNLYVGGLMGLQQQIVANGLQISWSALRGAGAVLVLWLVWPTTTAFFAWQVLSNVVYFACVRSVLWRCTSHGGLKPRFEWLVFRSTWRYAAGMACMAFVSTVLTQADKLCVSKLLSLETFGYYMLAVAVAGVPRMLASPIGTAAFPRLTALVESGDHMELVRFYHRTSTLVAAVVIPVGVTLAMFAGDFLVAWTGDAAAAEHVTLAAAALILGEVMQMITLVPYYLALAHGEVSLNLRVNIVAVFLAVPLLISLVGNYGVVGAGISWLAVNLFTLPAYLHLIHRRFMAGGLEQYILRDVGRPFAASLPCIAIGEWILPHFESRFGTICVIGALAGVGIVISVSLTSELRREVADIISRVVGRKSRFLERIRR